MAGLDAIFDLNHALLPAAARRLTDEDATALRRIAVGEVVGPNRARAAEAFTLAKGAEAVPLLSGIVENTDEDVALRAQAATILAAAPARPAEQALLTALAK